MLLNKFRWNLYSPLCNGCIPQEGVVEEINSLLSPNKRIRNINVLWDFNYEINLNPEINMLNSNATPSIFLNGNLQEGFGGRAYFKGLLKGYFEL